MNDKWDKRFSALARHVSFWSKDPSTKVGAVIVRPDNTVASLGYNGFPRGVNDDDRLFDRKQKYPMTVHAEMNAILHASENLYGYTLYVYPLLTCANCAAAIIQAGITSVVAVHRHNDRWIESNDIALTMFDEAGVHVRQFSHDDFV
jgi:dCMP deaminase